MRAGRTISPGSPPCPLACAQGGMSATRQRCAHGEPACPRPRAQWSTARSWRGHGGAAEDGRRPDRPPPLPSLGRRARQRAASRSPDPFAFRFACADLLAKSLGSPGLPRGARRGSHRAAGANAAEFAKNCAYLCSGALPAAGDIYGRAGEPSHGGPVHQAGHRAPAPGAFGGAALTRRVIRDRAAIAVACDALKDARAGLMRLLDEAGAGGPAAPGHAIRAAHAKVKRARANLARELRGREAGTPRPPMIRTAFSQSPRKCQKIQATGEAYKGLSTGCTTRHSRPFTPVPL